MKKHRQTFAVTVVLDSSRGIDIGSNVISRTILFSKCEWIFIPLIN